jgi:hypothetical protein
MNDQFAQRSRDIALLTQLAEIAEPTCYDKVMLGALMMRYQGQPFLTNIEVVIKTWKLTQKELYRQCRQIWADGFRPEDLQTEGSSWDATPAEDQ